MTDEVKPIEKIGDQIKQAEKRHISSWIGTGYARKLLFDMLKPEFPEHEGYNQAIWDMIRMLNTYDTQRIERDLKDGIRPDKSKRNFIR